MQAATIIGYCSVGGRPFTVRRLGVIVSPDRDGAYYLAYSTAGRDTPGYCYGGAIRPELAAEIVRERWGYPGESICSHDGQYIRR